MKIFTAQRSAAVSAYGELRLIEQVRGWLGDVTPRAPFGIGDDCAVLPPARRAQLVTTDPVIYGWHFDDAIPARAVGAKLLKRNLSDIAAMGGRPVAAVISLALAANTRVAWLRDFYLGLADCARRFGVNIVGGDVAQAPAGFFGAFLTLHGEATNSRIVTRQGARAGDRIYVTGSLGGSRLGKHFQFTPRLAEGAWLAGRPEVRAMMDVSDGLAKDLTSLTTAGLVPALCGPAVPVSPAARTSAERSHRTALAHALSDGEDYELLVVVRGRADAKKFEQAWRKRFPRLRLTLIGTFAKQGKLPAGALRLADYHGYEHLR
ncbi:MAG: thiamine-monophosphate kinase [Opitutae bacterium]|nr:thiamine-monophosphate kinase [Opitutae bacterium]